MFGYVLPNQAELTDAQKGRFSAFYCGVCHALQRDWGLTGRLALKYDSAFLALLLSSLYEPETARATARCAVHPARPRAYVTNDRVRYAAAMDFALAYHKLKDDWTDDRSLTALSSVRLMERRYREAERRYPRQTAAIREGLSEIQALEKADCRVVDLPARRFGAILGEVFAPEDDLWAEDLRGMGSALGEFIYLMDAYEDLPRDAKRGRYNPLRELEGDPGLDGICREMLTVMIARCTEHFERLPLVEDLDLLRNILYSGVWTRFEAVRLRREQARKGAKE